MIRRSSREPEPVRPDGLTLGLGIQHPTFGAGQITHLDGDRVTVLFDKSGVKKIAASFVKPA